MTIKPTLVHKANWLLSGTTPSATQQAMCASRLTSSASYVGRPEAKAFLDRRRNTF